MKPAKNLIYLWCIRRNFAGQGSNLNIRAKIYTIFLSKTFSEIQDFTIWSEAAIDTIWSEAAIDTFWNISFQKYVLITLMYIWFGRRIYLIKVANLKNTNLARVKPIQFFVNKSDNKFTLFQCMKLQPYLKESVFLKMFSLATFRGFFYIWSKNYLVVFFVSSTCYYIQKIVFCKQFSISWNITQHVLVLLILI